VPPVCLLLVSADTKGLATMAAALAGHFPVLTAPTPESALGLITQHGPCDAAFCEMSGDPQSVLELAERLALASPSITVTAMVRPPCPAIIRQAMAEGRIDHICLLPLSAESLREKARRVLAGSRRGGSSRPESPTRVLTREEVAFLLGHDPPETRRPSRFNH
jgi:DNA-binding NarL/FixJ family response regulator